MFCPYCNNLLDIEIASKNACIYGGVKLVATSCCSQPITVHTVHRAVVTKATTQQETDDWGVPFSKSKVKLELTAGQNVVYIVGNKQTPTFIRSVEAFQHYGHDLYRISLDCGFMATFYQDSERYLSDTMFGYGNGVNKILI